MVLQGNWHLSITGRWLFLELLHWNIFPSVEIVYSLKCNFFQLFHLVMYALPFDSLFTVASS